MSTLMLIYELRCRFSSTIDGRTSTSVNVHYWIETSLHVNMKCWSWVPYDVYMNCCSWRIRCQNQGIANGASSTRPSLKSNGLTRIKTQIGQVFSSFIAGIGLRTSFWSPSEIRAELGLGTWIPEFTPILFPNDAVNHCSLSLIMPWLKSLKSHIYPTYY